MLSDPITITYNAVNTDLNRLGSDSSTSFYRDDDGEFEMVISNSTTPDGNSVIEIQLYRVLPDPTPSDAFDAYRRVANSFGLRYEYDPTRAELAVDMPRLRTCLLALVDSTFQGKILSGQK
jgi:hypothetical protein